jgi:hypothetical protein
VREGEGPSNKKTHRTQHTYLEHPVIVRDDFLRLGAHGFPGLFQGDFTEHVLALVQVLENVRFFLEKLAFLLLQGLGHALVLLLQHALQMPLPLVVQVAVFPVRFQGGQVLLAGLQPHAQVDDDALGPRPQVVQVHVELAFHLVDFRLELAVAFDELLVEADNDVVLDLHLAAVIQFHVVRILLVLRRTVPQDRVAFQQLLDAVR